MASVTTPPFRLLIIAGQEGSGKSTVIRGLLPDTPCGARIDGEDVGQVNPWIMDEAFRDLHRRNVAALVHNFWRSGYANVIAGSFLSSYPEYLQFRRMLSEPTDICNPGPYQAAAAGDLRRRGRAARQFEQSLGARICRIRAVAGVRHSAAVDRRP
ncbi:MAG: hypothetical protein ACRDT6_24810 [Micromonosporaceae bacterium]